MRQLLIALCALFTFAFAAPAQYVKVELGKGFYYRGDSSAHHILFLPSFEDTATSDDLYPKIVWPVITEVESFGFNDHYIIAITKSKGVTSWWIIDKTRDTDKLAAHEEGDRIVLPNVKKVDAARFTSLAKDHQVAVRPVAYYRKAGDDH